MGEPDGVYVLEEPASGLRPADAEQVVGHPLAVMARAAPLIDLGAGHEGARVVFTGSPAELVAYGATSTGAYVARYVRS